MKEQITDQTPLQQPVSPSPVDEKIVPEQDLNISPAIRQLLNEIRNDEARGPAHLRNGRWMGSNW